MRECLCGTVIPADGSEWEPGCRHCQYIFVNRLVEA